MKDRRGDEETRASEGNGNPELEVCGLRDLEFDRLTPMVHPSQAVRPSQTFHFSPDKSRLSSRVEYGRGNESGWKERTV